MGRIAKTRPQRDDNAARRRADTPGMEETIDLGTVGGRIAWARIRKNMTQNQLAKVLHRARPTVVQYEGDKIEPPLTVLNELSKVLGVSPEFLAFQRQGVAVAANAATEIVTMPEITVGKDGAYNSSAFAFPKRMLDTFGISKDCKVYVLQQNAPAFHFQSGTRLFVDTNITSPVTSYDLYLVRTEAGIEIIRREPIFGSDSEAAFIVASGQRIVVDTSTLNFVGAIVGVIQKT